MSAEQVALVGWQLSCDYPTDEDLEWLHELVEAIEEGQPVEDDES